MRVIGTMLTILMVFVLFGIQNGGTETLPEKIEKVKSYEDDISASLRLAKSDKQLIVTWTERFQVEYVNLTTEYRIQMLRHRDHSFRTNVSSKWEDCIRIYRRSIHKMEHNYNEGERECLRTALTAGDEKREAVGQLEKEIKKWRKGYKYLVSLCKSNYFNEEEIASCVVEYVEKDSYNRTLKRLILLKFRGMAELLLKFYDALVNLEECLRINLSEFLSNIRYIMKVLDRCYTGRKNK